MIYNSHNNLLEHGVGVPGVPGLGLGVDGLSLADLEEGLHLLVGDVGRGEVAVAGPVCFTKRETNIYQRQILVVVTNCQN